MCVTARWRGCWVWWLGFGVGGLGSVLWGVWHTPDETRRLLVSQDETAWGLVHGVWGLGWGGWVLGLGLRARVMGSRVWVTDLRMPPLYPGAPARHRPPHCAPAPRRPPDSANAHRHGVFGAILPVVRRGRRDCRFRAFLFEVQGSGFRLPLPSGVACEGDCAHSSGTGPTCLSS